MSFPYPYHQECHGLAKCMSRIHAVGGAGPYVHS